jgi:DNA-binding transcriptional regulator YhcF (GntR family)
MPATAFFSCLSIDAQSPEPKYRQLATSIRNAIQQGKIGQERILPSINELSFELDVSRDTAERAYRCLLREGVLASVPGKGYYARRPPETKHVLLLFNKLSAHKKIIYDSLTAALGDQASVELIIYHSDPRLFTRILKEKAATLAHYSHLVIMPFFTEDAEEASAVINSLPKDKLILLDKKPNCITGNFGAVSEPFEKDIYNALETLYPKLNKYQTLKLIFPAHSYQAPEIVEGFRHFCRDFAFDARLVSELEKEPIHAGEVFIDITETDLATLIERIRDRGLRIGEQVGIISYNETPLKRVLLNGITTISTDFAKMGEWTAKMILEDRKEQLEVPFMVRVRPSV